MKECWLSDPGVINLKEFVDEKLNIIDAPCGCGKTTFVEEHLWARAHWGPMLYLIDTKNALEAFKERGRQRRYRDDFYYVYSGITAMTYATFAMLCIYQEDNWLWDDALSCIVCDEMQSVIKWSKIKQGSCGTEPNLHEVALREIHRRIKTGVRVVAITATPDLLRREFANEYFDVPIHGTLRRYRAENTVSFQNLMTLLDELPKDKRGVIYTPHVSQLLAVKAKLVSKGIKAVGFWSLNNEEYEMNDEELAVRESVVLREVIPKDVQVLLINAASETGLNIKSPVDYIVVNDSNKNTQVQAMGRIRHDIETAYLRDYSDDGSFVYISATRLDHEKWLNKPLFEEDKIELCNELNLRDRRGRPCKWTSVKRSLKFSHYKVVDKQEKNGRRYSIIGL